ncbi:DUF6985 domain-containing protein [Jiangella endophytica]|uniref:DUF6985 domain-containing protein n=1 Tax=Jiangella endophytica TaxID=1623398 RepID=UPI000E3523CB|nr:hypothetical protein [Jiangella endophytica]
MTTTQVGDEPGFPQIPEPRAVWDFVELTGEPYVERYEATWYVVLENECAWEPQHGLMIMLRDSRAVTKASAYDGHVTNRNAYGDGDPRGGRLLEMTRCAEMRKALPTGSVGPSCWWAILGLNQ